jgi:hypothetical protein
MKVIKNIKSWCKLTIPSITGLALSWKNICQGEEESREIIEKWAKEKVQSDIYNYLNNLYILKSLFVNIRLSKHIKSVHFALSPLNLSIVNLTPKRSINTDSMKVSKNIVHVKYTYIFSLFYLFYKNHAI